MTRSTITKLLLIGLIFLFGMGLTLPIISKVPPHPDEYQFNMNAFSIMAGEELHNYYHVALTEYALAGIFSILNLVTDTGVNFPQGAPSLATYFYGRFFGFGLYLATYFVGVILLQRDDTKPKLRTVIFSALYFGSISFIERFLRVNSDSMMIFVFLNFVVLSLWLHKKKASPLKFFFLNLIFLFLSSFTNFKALYLILPLFVINYLVPFLFYDTSKEPVPRLLKMYRMFLCGLGQIFGTLILWSALVPKPFNHIKFWYGIKKTIVHGTKFDFEYPLLAYESGKAYIYDLFAIQLTFPVVIAMLIVFYLSYRWVGKGVFSKALKGVYGQFRWKNIKNGDLYKSTELILFVSALFYYFGVSSRVIHWSRWGSPLGMVAILVLSTVLEPFLLSLKNVPQLAKKRFVYLIIGLFVFISSFRVMLSIDLIRADYPLNSGFNQTIKDINEFLDSEGVPEEERTTQAYWFTGYTQNIGNFSLDHLPGEAYRNAKYIFWPHWNMGLLHTKENVDLTTHNQRAFVDKYASRIIYRFPSLLSRYIHYTKYFAWNVLSVTWLPEVEDMIEKQYGITELKEPVESIRLNYVMNFDDMSHYHFPYSLLFNMQTLPESYVFPPCYSYPDVVELTTGDRVNPPPEFGVGGRTAGLYCHSVRFRILFKGRYRIRMENLPEDTNGAQKVFSSMAGTVWDPDSRTLSFESDITYFSGDFGVALEEEKVKNLKFVIFYIGE